MEDNQNSQWIHKVEKVRDSLYRITNTATGWSETFVYNEINSTRGYGYKVETGWGGPLEPLLKSFLPVMDLIYRRMEPHSEKFSWEVKTIETQYGGKEYTDMDHRAIYTCHVTIFQPELEQSIDMEMETHFYNGRFGGVTLKPQDVDLPQKRIGEMESSITQDIRKELGLR